MREDECRHSGTLTLKRILLEIGFNEEMITT